jgi:hypothetical protein
MIRQPDPETSANRQAPEREHPRSRQGRFAYLTNVERVKRFRKAKAHPQSVWFEPF